MALPLLFAALTEVASFGANPAQLTMKKHVPAAVPAGQPEPLTVTTSTVILPGGTTSAVLGASGATRSDSAKPVAAITLSMRRLPFRGMDGGGVVWTLS